MNEKPTPDSILQEVLRITGLEERAAYLERACGEDEALRQQVESLLAAQFAVEAFLDSTVAAELAGATKAGAVTVGSPDMPTLGTKIGYFGDYELLEEIARGGMGAHRR